MAKTYIKGLDKVLKNLNKEIENIKGRTLKGFIQSAVLIRRDMEDTSPKIPVDTGNLRASWFVATSKGNISSGNSAKFKGENAGEMASNHIATIYSNLGAIKGGLGIIMGFTAHYAVFVHEMIGANFARPKVIGGKETKRREGAGAKFFEAALKRNTDKILEIVGKSARIPR